MALPNIQQIVATQLGNMGQTVPIKSSNGLPLVGGQTLPPVSSPPLAPTVVPSAEKETEATDGAKSNTMLYVGIGVGVVVLIIVAYFIFRK